MTIRAKRITVYGASIALALMIGVVGVTAAQGDTTLAIPLPSMGEMIGTAIAGIAAFFGKRLFRLLDGLAQNIRELRDDMTEVKTLIKGVDGRGGIIDDVRELQREQALMSRPVAPPAGFSIASHVTAKEPT